MAVVLAIACTLPISARASGIDADPLVDAKAGVPTLFAFDVKPGYMNYVLVPIAPPGTDDFMSLRMQVTPPKDADWAAGHWNPTAFLCLKPSGRDAKQSYCANLMIDASTLSFGTARLVSEAGDEVFRKLTSRQFSPGVPRNVEIVRKGTHVTTTIEGEVVDERDIGFVAEYWMIGASTAVARIEVLVEPEEDVEIRRNDWPRTVDEAVDEAISHMKSDSKAVMRTMSKAELDNYWIGWGTSLRDRQGLSFGNETLRKAVCGMNCSPDAATRLIMEAVWKTLNEQPER